MEALSRIEARAAELGFVEADAVEYLVVEAPLVERTAGETPPTPRTASQDQAESSPPKARDLWGELAAQFAAWINPQE
jgi:hypothetical protein